MLSCAADHWLCRLSALLLLENCTSPLFRRACMHVSAQTVVLLQPNISFWTRPVLNTTCARHIARTLSVDLVRRIWAGEFSTAVPAMSFCVVDVRDAAAAHVSAAFAPSTKGRHILCTGGFTVAEVVSVVHELHPKKVGKPWATAPRWLLYAVAPLLKMRRDVVWCARLAGSLPSCA